MHEQRIVHVRPIVVEEPRVVIPDVSGGPFVRVGFGEGIGLAETP